VTQEIRSLRLLGLAQRGGLAVVGTRPVREAARKGQLAAALLARDAGPNARERVVPLLTARGVPLAECGDGETLGRALGRQRVVVVGVRDGDIARQIMEELSEDGGNAREGGS
jgi:ribosomal protein L7Ae-like RNA K-turn-binding protein